jgi:hypothetical protein
VNSPGSPRLVSELPVLHLSRSVPVHRDLGGDGGDGATLRPVLSDSSDILKRQILADAVFLRFNGRYERLVGPRDEYELFE